MPHALNIVVLVSGRGSNLQAIIDAARDGDIKSRVIKVISDNPAASALERARNVGIDTLVIAGKNRPKKDFFRELDTVLRTLAPELIVLAGFMRILPAEIVRHFAGRIINIHPSLLPAFPGLNAQRQALTAGEPFTGCTVHFVDVGCDTGPIILQRRIKIASGDTVATLSQRLLVEEHRALVDAIRGIENGEIAVGRR